MKNRKNRNPTNKSTTPARMDRPTIKPTRAAASDGLARPSGPTSPLAVTMIGRRHRCENLWTSHAPRHKKKEALKRNQQECRTIYGSPPRSIAATHLAHWTPPAISGIRPVTRMTRLIRMHLLRTRQVATSAPSAALQSPADGLFVSLRIPAPQNRQSRAQGKVPWALCCWPGPARGYCLHGCNPARPGQTPYSRLPRFFPGPPSISRIHLRHVSTGVSQANLARGPAKCNCLSYGVPVGSDPRGRLSPSCC
jgi:hypothetical protein